MREGKPIVIADTTADDTAAATKTKAQQKAESKKRLESMVDGGDDVGAARKDFNKGIFLSLVSVLLEMLACLMVSKKQRLVTIY